MTNLKNQKNNKINKFNKSTKTNKSSKIIEYVKNTKTTEKKPMSYNNYNYKKTFSELPEVTYAIEPDWDLVLGILKQRRHSRSETEQIFIRELQEFFTLKGAITTRDTFGNLYVVKGKATQYRCMVAHTDINQAKRDRVHLYMNNEWIFGFDMDEGCQAGIGADDGVGISLAIEMFNRFDAIKLFFPMSEEIGCLGSANCNTDFFSDCTMIVQGDRRSFTNDLITFTNGIEVCSQEFVDAASEISLKYGYAAARGVCTDI